LRSIVSPARALLRGGSGGRLWRLGPEVQPAGIPPAAPVIRHPAPSGCSGAACCGTAGLKNRDIPRAARPGNQATGFQPLAGMSPVTVPSSLARQEPRQRGVVSSPAIRARVVSLASAGGSDVWLSFSAAPTNSHQTGAAPTKAGPGGRSRGAIQGAIGGRY
jgi:hypothetical protein